MKNPDLLDELLDDQFHARMDKIISCQSDNFVTIVEAAGIDKSFAFRNADLCGVDFSGCDLRGFDFQGADLRGSTGIDTQWDETTNFDAADLEGSPFVHNYVLEKKFASNPEAQKAFKRLRNQDVYQKSSWILSKADRKSEEFELNKIVALKLFEDEENVTVRNSLIYGAKSYFWDQTEYRDFITSIFAQRETDSTTFRAALNVLAKVFNYDETVQNLLLSVIRHCENNHKVSALEGLVRSRDYPLISRKIKHELYSPKLESFRIYLLMRAFEETLDTERKRNSRSQPPFLILKASHRLDFAKTVDDEKLLTLLAETMVGRRSSNGDAISQEQVSSKNVKSKYNSVSRQFQSALKSSVGKRQKQLEGLPEWALQVREAGQELIDQFKLIYSYTGIRYHFSGELSRVMNLKTVYSAVSPNELGRVPSILQIITS